MDARILGTAARKRLMSRSLLLAAPLVFVMSESHGAEPAVPVLPDTIVTATLAPSDPRNIGSALTVITEEEIEKRQATSVPELLRDVQGLAVSRSGPFGGFTQIRIRGTEANQVLFLVDGVEANDPNTSEPLWGDILPGDIERIEVLRGSQSSLHGSDAIGGVIHIITKRGRGKPKFTAMAETGSFDTYTARTGVSGGGNNYHYAANVMGFTTRGVSQSKESTVNPAPNDRDGYRNITVSTKLGASPVDDLDLEFSARYLRSSSQIDNFTASNEGPDQIDADRRTNRKQFFGGAKGSYRLFDDAWEHVARVQWSEIAATTLQDGAPTSFDKSNGRKIKFAYHNNLKYDLEALANSHHTLTVGLETEHEKFASRSAKRTRDNDGFFAEYQLELWDRLTLTGSGRYDRNDVFKNADTWRGTAAYRLDEWSTKLRLSYATGVKNPTFSELFGSSNGFVGNPNLQPETNRSLDFGIEQRLWDDRVQLDGTLFFNRVQNLITGSGNSSRNQGGTTKIWGIEMSADVEVTESLFVNAAYTYTNHKDSSDQELVRRAKHIASANVQYRFMEEKARLYLGVDFNGTQQDIDFDTSFNRSRVKLASFTNITLGGSYQVREGVVLKGRVENLLDNQYEEVFGFQSPGLGVYVGLSGAF